MIENLVISPEEVLSSITRKRMCSVENLSFGLSLPTASLWPVLLSLESMGSIRIVKNVCGTSCSSCPSCHPGGDAYISKAIVISLERKEGSCDGTER